MISKLLKEIKPEFDHALYSKPGETFLFGPDSQHLNNTTFESEEPTRPLDLSQNLQWARIVVEPTRPGEKC